MHSSLEVFKEVWGFRFAFQVQSSGAKRPRRHEDVDSSLKTHRYEVCVFCVRLFILSSEAVDEDESIAALQSRGRLSIPQFFTFILNISYRSFEGPGLGWNPSCRQPAWRLLADKVKMPPHQRPGFTDVARAQLPESFSFQLLLLTRRKAFTLRFRLRHASS